MRRVTIRLKLAATLAVPLVVLVVVTSIEIARSIGEAREAREQTQLAQASLGPDGLIDALQVEGRFATAYTVGLEATADLPVADNGEARQVTDRAAEEFRRQTERRGGPTLAAYEPALDGLADLADARASVDAYAGRRDLASGLDVGNRIFQEYAEIIDRFYTANGHIAAAVDDPELRTATELINFASRQIDVGANLTRVVIFSQLTGSGLGDPSELAEIASVVNDYDTLTSLIQARATGVYRPIAERLLVRSERLTRYRTVIDEALAGGQIAITDVLETNTSGGDSEFLAFRDEVAAQLADRADELNDAATTRERRYLAAGGFVVVAAVAGTWMVTRSITRPLRALTGQATDMARRRLPEAVRGILESPLGENVTIPDVAPVEVTSRDEVADVAEALNVVQRAAVDLAVEQAVLRRNIADSFVNLGRRNQNLLARQLDFITALESNETDPDTLASLFRLDHLATRMRRNAESLLVLAGVDPPRKWTAPVSLTDVIRAAVGEVEDYQRVALRAVEPATIVGSAATDLAHMLAELVENALAFSPPDEAVEIYGRAHPDGYILAVVDNGHGMPSAEIETANRRLAGTESFTVAPSRYLGHYVAGRLAARHGIEARVDRPTGRGLTVTVTLPPGLLAAGAVDAQTGGPLTGPATPSRARRALMTATAAPAASDGRVPASPPLDQSRPAAHTPSGLAKRAPHAAAPAPAAPSDDLLAALSRHTANLRRRPVTAAPRGAERGAWPYRNPPPGPATTPPGVHTMPAPAPPAAPPWTRPSAAIPDRTAGVLTRRVPGAQHPDTSAPSLVRRHAPPSAPPPAAAPSPHSAEDVYSFLRNFSSGVQRGLGEATNRPGQSEA